MRLWLGRDFVVKPIRDRKFLAFVRSLPCVVCGRQRGVEAAHTSAGERGMAQKVSDRLAIPLCVPHHREYHSLGEKAFAQRHSLDIRAIVGTLNQRPRIRIQGPGYTLHFEGEQYFIGPLSIGLKRATHTAIVTARDLIADSLATLRRANAQTPQPMPARREEPRYMDGRLAG